MAITNIRKQAQFNTVVVQQEEMDRVGFEPTTSAMPRRLSIFYLNSSYGKRSLRLKSHPLLFSLRAP
jgi:hypothetical protein